MLSYTIPVIFNVCTKFLKQLIQKLYLEVFEIILIGEKEQKPGRTKGRINLGRLIPSQTAQLVIPNVCTRFQNPSLDIFKFIN